jgi:hypothetical protein
VPADWRTETFHEHFAVRNRIPPGKACATSASSMPATSTTNHEFLYDLKNDPDELKTSPPTRRTPRRSEAMRERTAERRGRTGRPADPPLKGEFQASTDAASRRLGRRDRQARAGRLRESVQRQESATAGRAIRSSGRSKTARSPA